MTKPIDSFVGVMVELSENGVPGDWLVVENPKVPSSWHLRVKRNGVPDHNLMGAAFSALYKNYRGKPYAGPKKEEAKKKLASLYKSEKLPMPQKSEMMMDKEDMEEGAEKDDNDAEDKAEKKKEKKKS